VSNFVVQAQRRDPLTVYGDGRQTRSLCYASDSVAGVIALLDSDVVDPVNIGIPEEFTLSELAQIVIRLTGTTSPIVHEPLPQDDSIRRWPDIERSTTRLGCHPREFPRGPSLHTIVWFRSEV